MNMTHTSEPETEITVNDIRKALDELAPLIEKANFAFSMMGTRQAGARRHPGLHGRTLRSNLRHRHSCAPSNTTSNEVQGKAVADTKIGSSGQ